MKPFWNELKYFISQVKNGYPRFKEDKELRIRMAPMMSSELEKCSREECVEAALIMCGNHLSWLGVIFFSLIVRAGRGKVTLSSIVKLFQREVTK